MGIEKGQEVLMSGDECGVEGECEDAQILTIRDTVQKVVVKKEPRASQFLTIQDEECGHTKWLDTYNIKKNDYVTLSQEGGVRGKWIFSLSPVKLLQ